MPETPGPAAPPHRPHAHAHDFDRDAVRGAILREGGAFLAHALLLPFGFRKVGRPSERKRELRTVVFVHGLAANRSGFMPLQAYLRRLGHREQLAFNYRSAGSLEAIALRLRREIDARVRGGRIDLVAHSMGGLVARHYLQVLGGARRVDRLITLGTPHQGTYAATFLPSALVRQLHPDSAFLRRLNALPAPAGVDVTSVVAGRDLLIQPTSAAQCPFGRVIEHPDLGHLELLFRPRVIGEIAGLLHEPASNRLARE